MSVNLVVYLKRDRLPNCEEWQRAVAAEGIDMTMDVVDTRTHTGFWPLRHQGQECGFEYTFGEIETIDQEDLTDLLKIVGDRDCSVDFKWHGSVEDGRAAAIAAAVLAKLVDGVFVDPQSDESAVGAAAFELLIRQEQAERQRKMEDAIRRWGKLTQRRCPECDAPCPEFRPTCKVCGFAIGRA